MKVIFEGYISALRHEVDQPIRYFMKLGEQEIALQDWIGKNIRLTFLDKRSCVNCGRQVKKLFHNGYCYPCFTTLAECDLCIVKPHECHFDQGTCRDENFAASHCMIPHLVYLAVSSGIKVGLTRKNRELIRWVDQGAVYAVPIAETPTRKLAGELEMEIAKHLPDKTDWRKMLKGEIESVDLLSIRQEVKARLPESFRPYLLDDADVRDFLYPLEGGAPKLKSCSFDKQPEMIGTLLGIKGQYLVFDTGVLNIKKHAGYLIKWEEAIIDSLQGVIDL